ncbi:Protein of unknown function DUF4804 [Trinorchestia longiramus]|nr:Protein of unknown function DUF4804 [Trinorchestia longiramus]
MNDGHQSTRNETSGRGGRRGRGRGNAQHGRGFDDHQQRNSGWGRDRASSDGPPKGVQETPPGDTQKANGAHHKQDKPLGLQEPPSSGNQRETAPASKNSRPNVKNPDSNWSADWSDSNSSHVPSNDKNWSAQNGHKKRDGQKFGESRANGYGWQDQPRFQTGAGAGAPHYRQGSRSTNPRTDSSYVHRAPVDQQFKSHARQNLHKRLTPIEHVKLEGEPSSDVIASLAKSDVSVPSTNLEEVIEKSIKFWDKFPSETARLHVLKKRGVDKHKLEDFVHSVYPIVHHTCLQLIWDFLDQKRRYGSNAERKVYVGMDIVDFIDRLLKKRPMSFLGPDDRYYLPPPMMQHGFGGFEAIGTDEQKYPLVLENFLSYDEMRVSALLSLSSWSWFVNDGRRKNYGEKDPEDKYQTEGVIVGQVGARLRKEEVMEYVDCVITRRQNNPDGGFGDSSSSHINAVWGKFWGGQLPTFQDANACLQVQQGGKRASPFEYLAVGKDNLFNITVFKKRIAITAEILLCEANTRARAYGKKAYVHVVGLGLGVWRAFEEQDELFVEAWGDALKNLTDLSQIAFVDFSYINSSSVHGTKNNEKFPGTDVVVKFSKRNLHDKVPEDCILVCSYAWDGNSLPGNEFWMGKLCSTGDSAAACSSCVAEIHNHFINPVVCGAAVRIATKEGQLLDISDYLKKMKKVNFDVSNLNQYGVKQPSAGVAAACPAPVDRRQMENITTTTTTSTTLAQTCDPGVERQVIPASEPVPCSNGAWGNAASPSSWHQDAELANATASPADVGTAAAATSFLPTSPSTHVRVSDRETPQVPATTQVTGVVDESFSGSDVPNAASPDAPAKGIPKEIPAASASAAAKDIPKEIRHPTIPGCMIPNPEYVKQEKERKKAEKKEKAKAKKEKENLEKEPQNKEGNQNTSSKKKSKQKNKSK